MGTIVGTKERFPPTAAILLSEAIYIWLEEPAEEVFQGAKSRGRAVSVLSVLPVQGSTWTEISLSWRLPFFQKRRRSSTMKKWGEG